MSLAPFFSDSGPRAGAKPEASRQRRFPLSAFRLSIMPDISAFRALRYDLGHVGSLSDVIAPPYDVIGPELQDELYKRHPANVVRLILNRDEPGDDEQSNRYTRAARFLKNWRSEGVLFAEPDPAVYVYHQVFEANGQTYTRRGFMCRTKLERLGEGKIYPHEQTHSKAKEDRLKLTKACKTNLSQIFGIYPDPENEAQNLLERTVAGQTPLEAKDHLGVIHRVWPVTDVSIISELEGIMGPKPTFIADGHHRYETALNYRDWLSERQGGELPADHPANFVLMMCIGMNDPGMIVLPTHRLFRGVPEMSADELAAKLGDQFKTTAAGNGPEAAGAVWEEIETEDEQGTLAFYTAQDDAWTLVRVADAGRKKMAEIAAEQSEDWRGLGVSILHRLVMDTLLGLPDLPAPKYVHSVEEVVEGLKTGDKAGRDATGQEGQGGKFNLAALVMPATLDHIRAISEHGERMPAKSTYFYPKLLSGLVFNPLE
jgi:uncharacterized protein (DUF1015 family)